MVESTFSTLKEARAWLRESAITEAAAPFRRFLPAAPVVDVLDSHETGFAPHPELRTLATRAARALVPPVVGELRAAARKVDREDAIPLGPSAEVTRFEPGLAGKPDLGRKNFHAAALGVIKALAKFVAKAWGRDDVDDMIGEGWLVAVIVTPTWDSTKAAYETYLWSCVRARLIDYSKRAQHRRERPCGAWAEDVSIDDFAATDPEGQLREGLAAMATSYCLGLPNDAGATPEERLLKVAERAEIRAIRAELPERQAKLVTLVYDEDLPVKRAAAMMGVPHITARRDHHDAQGFVRARLAGNAKFRVVRSDDAAPQPRVKAKKPVSAKRPPLRLVPPPPAETDDD